MTDSLSRYYTSKPIALAMAGIAARTVELPKARILEPSAGEGVIVGALIERGANPRKITAYDIDKSNANCLTSNFRGINVCCADFLSTKLPTPRKRYDIAVMNPPYEDGADSAHVRHALDSSNMVIALVRVVFLCGARRFSEVWAHHTLRQVVFLSTRPKFNGPADTGHTARHDYAIVVVQRGDVGHVPHPSIEWFNGHTGEWMR